MISSTKAFTWEWLRAPLRVGAIVPSGKQLANAITDDVSSDAAPVIELGPGTGVFTRALLRRGLNQHQIAAIERGPHFAEALKVKHPAIHVIQGDACEIERLSPFPHWSVGKVVCGLPLVSMPAAAIARIVLGSFQLLRSDGSFRFFTYASVCSVPKRFLHQNGLTVRRVATAIMNLPPASVYELRRAD